MIKEAITWQKQKHVKKIPTIMANPLYNQPKPYFFKNLF